MQASRKSLIVESARSDLFGKSSGLTLENVRFEELYQKKTRYENRMVFIENESRFKGKIREIMIINPGLHMILFYPDSIHPEELIDYIQEGILESVNLHDRESIVEIDRKYRKESNLLKLNYYNNLIKKFQNIGIVTRSLKMAALFAKIEKVADTNASCMIYGESGTGKELIARSIHYFSRRRQNRFVAVNTGAIPENLLEDELFGHKKGAFTSASSERQGKFEYADRGSIFLDEISNMPMSLQVKLLRVLQEKELERIGDNRTIKVDVRVIAASNTDIMRLVREGIFREDLFYRINVIPLFLPPLRSRRKDIRLLADYFAQKYCKMNKLKPKGFSPAALNRFCQYHWPGNIRQLENIVERMVLLNSEKKLLTPREIPGEIHIDSGLESVSLPGFRDEEIPDEGIELNKVLGQIEKNLIMQSLKKTSGNKKRAADLLNINRTTLIEKLKKYQNE